MTERKVVKFVVPTMGLLRCELAMYREWMVDTEKRYKLVMGYSEGQPIANNRNMIVQRFLQESPRGDYLMTIDSDSVPFAFNPFDLVEHDKDIILVPTPTWQGHKDSPLQWLPCPPNPGAGLTRIEEGGGSLMLIARRVLEHPDMRGPFLDEWDDDGLRTMSEDRTFVRRALEYGFEVWCDLDKRMAHWKTVELCGVADMVKGMAD